MEIAGTLAGKERQRLLRAPDRLFDRSRSLRECERQPHGRPEGAPAETRPARDLQALGGRSLEQGEIGAKGGNVRDQPPSSLERLRLIAIPELRYRCLGFVERELGVCFGIGHKEDRELEHPGAELDAALSFRRRRRLSPPDYLERMRELTHVPQRVTEQVEVSRQVRVVFGQ